MPDDDVDPPGSDPLERVRALCLGLPEATERLSHGEPTWFVGRSFVMYSDHHHGGPLAVWCAAAPGVLEEQVEREPERFFRPPYVGVRGWLGVRLDIDVDWDELAGIVTDAYRQVASRRLVARLDAADGAGSGGDDEVLARRRGEGDS